MPISTISPTVPFPEQRPALPRLSRHDHPAPDFSQRENRLRAGRHGQQHRFPDGGELPGVLLHGRIRAFPRHGRHHVPRGAHSRCRYRSRHGRGLRPHGDPLGQVPPLLAVAGHTVRRSCRDHFHYTRFRGHGKDSLCLRDLRRPDARVYGDQHPVLRPRRGHHRRFGRTGLGAVVAIRRRHGRWADRHVLHSAAGAVARPRRRRPGAPIGHDPDGLARRGAVPVVFRLHPRAGDGGSRRAGNLGRLGPPGAVAQRSMAPARADELPVAHLCGNARHRHPVFRHLRDGRARIWPRPISRWE